MNCHGSGDIDSKPFAVRNRNAIERSELKSVPIKAGADDFVLKENLFDIGTTDCDLMLILKRGGK